MSLLRLVLLFLQFLLHIQNVNAGDQALNLQPLYKNNKSPCDIMNEVASASCGTNQRRVILSGRYWQKRDVDVMSPTPSLCTCNEIFFNLLSACTLIVHSNTTTIGTLPLFSSWQQTCASRQVDVGASLKWAITYQNPDLPTWAGQRTGNGTFDVNLALAEVKGEKGWTMMQKMVPLIVGVGVLVLVGGVFLIYRHRRGGNMRKWAGVGWRSRFQKLLPRSRGVHTVDRSSTWTIDQFENTGYEDFVFLEAPSPGASADGHNIHSFSTLATKEHKPPKSPSPKSAEHPTEWQVPGKATWRNMHIPESVLSLPQRIPVLWKKKPIRVQPIAHTRRFRMDDYDKSTDASSSRRATSNFSHQTTVEGSSAPTFSLAHDTIIEEDDEQSSLITPLERSENSVFLISREPGVDFSSESGGSHPRSSTIHSQINIQTPTPTSATPSNGLHQSFRPSPLSAMPIPPVPSLPAPTPPANRWKPKPISEEEEEEYDHFNILPTSPPQTLTSSHVRNRSDQMAYTPKPEPRPSDDSLFSPAQSSSLNGYGILHTPPNHSGYSSDDPESYFPQQLGHSRGPSLDSLLRPSPANLPRIITNEDAGSVDRRTLHPVRSAVAIPESLHPPDSHHRNISVESLTPGRGDPVMGSHHAAHHRNISMESLTPNRGGLQVAHHRNVSTESVIPNRGDPVMLFPGSVRGAGYTVGSASTKSSESLYSQFSQQPSVKFQPNRRPSS